jgi:predicted aspartyl protease
MEVHLFDPREDLIFVTARVFGPSRSCLVRMALDTASAGVFVVPRIARRLGYSSRDAVRHTTVTTPLGQEPGYAVRVLRFEALGFRFEDFPVLVHELAVGRDVEGLLGLTFLRHFNFEVRPREGHIRLEPA